MIQGVHQLNANDLIKRISKNKNNQWIGHCQGLTLSSAFQPIISLNHRRVVGHEALLRTHNTEGSIISPAALFGSRKNITEIIELDRLCRVLHSSNYDQQQKDNEWLFLNINPEVINYGQHHGTFFSQLLETTNIEPSKIVVEVLEDKASNEKQLYKSVKYYRDLGCLIAIDDFGAGHSNIDRVLNIEPEIVKLDRDLLLNTTSCKAKRILSNLVALLHEAGCLVVLEGVETLEQALLAYEVDADLVQGFFFCRPSPAMTRDLDNSIFTEIITQLENQKNNNCISRNDSITSLFNIFQQSVYNYEAGINFTQAMEKLLNTNGTQLAYRINDKGFVIDDNLYPKNIEKKLRQKMAPMHQSAGANLSNRHYFQRAINNPGQTQTTRPYLSTTDAELCITLSYGINTRGKKEVICCDIKVPENI